MNLFKHFFRRGGETSTVNIQSAKLIIQDYGHFLEASPLPPASVADVNKLPHGKGTIKDAIEFYIKEA